MRWDRDKIMKVINCDFEIRKNIVTEIEYEMPKHEFQERVNEAEAKATPDLFWEHMHDTTIHRIAKQLFIF